MTGLKLSAVFAVLVTPIVIWLASSVIVFAVPCNTKRVPGNSKCDKNFPGTTYCITWQADTCASHTGAPLLMNPPQWAVGCIQTGGAASDHCIETPTDCLQKYNCSWNVTMGCIPGAIINGSFFQEGQGSSPSCDPSG